MKKYQQYFHCFIVCILVPYAFWFSYQQNMVTILISAIFRDVALTSGRRLFRCGHPKEWRSLEGDTYLRPDAYQRKYCILTGNKIPITVKISIYILSPIAFKTYPIQSKYSIRLNQRLAESKNCEMSTISNIHYLELFCWSRGSSRQRMSTVHYFFSFSINNQDLFYPLRKVSFTEE